MPFKDVEKQREYMAEYQRELRPVERDIIRKMRELGYSTQIRTVKRWRPRV